ncbi:condensation domain-containing protein [Prolixibacter denitrificans]|uniref:NRPS condensation-like uncharacterized protein n=1 Tax=Prolixibacter denitrificans TaxID=1541063 RepID=A0A2P8C6J0_9BACT|nr:condensation domain-containing protein [Prolixibacter denitrificans]PSK80571.1 NRPS condensation-like uncharacterized protein [Prolixibacter denitrificans]GET22133.1 hypothetical protein JCM18694_23790 [Prolixibacter denitrificans]
MAGFKTIHVPMWDQMQVFCKHIADHQIRLVLHFNGTLDEKTLRKAVQVTAENNPIVFSHYVEGKKAVLWQFSEMNVDEIYSFQECSEPEQLLQEIILKPIHTFAGPQLALSLIRAETDILILNCNHAISDAAGVKDFMYQLAENYSRLSRNEPVEQSAYTPARSLKTLSKKLGVKEKLSVLKVMLSGKKDAPTFRRTMELDKLQNPGFTTYTIEPSEFKKFWEFGQQHSATVNDLLLTVYYYTLKKMLPNTNKTNRITYSSDLRRYLDKADYDVLSNFSAIHNIDVDNSINDFAGLLKEISTTTRNRKQMKYSLADFPAMAALFKTIPYSKLKGIFHKEFDKIKEGKSDSSPSLSNTGIIEETNVAFDRLTPTQAYMLGGINHPGLLQLAASTYGHHLTLSIGSYFSGKNEVFIADFMEELKTTLRQEVLQSQGIK